MLTLIKSVSHLKKLAKNNTIGCFISFSGGMFRSSKAIFYDTDSKLFSITNEIDDTEQELNEEELYTKSNIGIAITQKSLYLY